MARVGPQRHKKNSEWLVLNLLADVSVECALSGDCVGWEMDVWPSFCGRILSCLSYKLHALNICVAESK
jgi:hypothetical protein